jgi:stage II sporulation protein R
MNNIIPGKKIESEVDLQTIPDDAIRLRILANSDEEADQAMKRLVRDNVNAYISDLVVEIADIEEARNMIQENLPEIRSIVAETLDSHHEEIPFTVDYSDNVTFPMKMYDHYLYPAGEYEAILITLGEGKGANWWCVLFPPLCFLDFSNGTTVEAEETEEIESNQDKGPALSVGKVEKERDDQGEDEEDNKVKEKEDEGVAETDEDKEDEEEVKITFFLFEWLGFS